MIKVQKVIEMGDLTIVSMQQCKKLSVTSIQIGDYVVSGMGSERTYPTCTCPAYRFGKREVDFGGRMYPKTCKHIDEAERLLVCWHEQWGEEVQTDEQRGQMICPKCGGETEWVQVGV